MNKRIILILGAAFFTRMAAIFLLGRHVNPELWEYNQIALNMLSGNGYTIKHLNTIYHSFGYPVYPFFSAGVLFLTKNNYFAIELIQVLLSVVLCYILYRIALKIFDENVALCAAFLTAMHPGLIIYASKIHELTMVALITILLVWMLIGMDQKRISSSLALGGVIGFGMLLRPTFLVFFPVYLFYSSFKLSKPKEYLARASIVLLAMVIVILPWSLRNYNIHKRWILITTNSAEHFWRGNNPIATGTALTLDNKGIVEASPAEFSKKLFSMTEMGQYDFFRKEAMNFIKNNPIVFLRNTAKKFIYFWWFSPQTGLWYPNLWTLIYKIFYIFVFALFILGIYRSYFLSREAKLFTVTLLLFFVLLALLHSFYYVELRHRWAVEPLMMIFSCSGIVFIYNAIRNKIKISGMRF